LALFGSAKIFFFKPFGNLNTQIAFMTESIRHTKIQSDLLLYTELERDDHYI